MIRTNSTRTTTKVNHQVHSQGGGGTPMANELVPGSLKKEVKGIIEACGINGTEEGRGRKEVRSARLG